MTQIVEKCEGLPLTLEVLGQFLRRKRNEKDWEQTLAALDEAQYVRNLNERLWMKLRPSIEGLEENEKQIFLDASTFFCYSLQKNKWEIPTYPFLYFRADAWTLREALAFWREAYGGQERLLWQTLVDKSLVYDVEEDEYIKLHEQLRSLGQKIADESNRYIVIRNLEDINLLQSTNEVDKKNIHALLIKMDLRGGEENHAFQSIADDDGDSERISSEDGKIHIASLALQELKDLRYLEIDIDVEGEIDGAAEGISFPSRLALLRCAGFKTLNLAHQSRLAVLSISGVESLPSAIGQLSALRIFTLGDSDVKHIPDEIAHLSKLEFLEIMACGSLRSLPESFGKLSALTFLRFDDCGALESLPESFGLLARLVDLSFWSCGMLESLPKTFDHLSALSRLDFFSCDRLRSLPESFGKLSALTDLRFEECGALESLPESFGLLARLVDLKFLGCEKLESLPKTFDHLSALSRLDFYSCDRLRSLPDSFGKLSALTYLRFEQCEALESLPESFGLLGALVDLKFVGCDNLECLPDTFGHLTALSRLEFQWCCRLRSLPESLGNLPVLRHLKVSNCDVLHPLPESLGRLAKLEYFEIESIKELERLPDSLAELGSLRHLVISKLLSLKSIPDYIQTLPSLHTLELGLLPQVKELPPWLGETGVNYLGISRKVFRIQDRHFFLTGDEIDFHSLEFDDWLIDLIGIVHSRAMEKVKTSDFEGALVELDVASLGIPKVDGFRLQEKGTIKRIILSRATDKVGTSDHQTALEELQVSSLGMPELDGFWLQEKGIIKRMMRNLHGALEDLTAAIQCFSKVGHGHHHSYNSWKHRGYVKFLMGDIEGAKNDGTMALKLQLDYRGSVLSARGYDSLGDECVEYMHFRLDTLQAMKQHGSLLTSTLHEVLQKVKVADFQGALASFDDINVLLLRSEKRSFFLQERGVLKGLAGDLGGALEDLTAALEILGDNYDCLKHRGYVKYLLGDVDGARLDAERCLQVGLPDYYPGAQHLAAASVAFMEYNLE